MAAKKTTSKAKTKTTKAAKTTKKTVSVKVTKTIRTVKNINLKRVNVLSALIFILSAAAAGVFMGPATYGVTVNYLSADAINQTVVPAYRHLKDIDLHWLLVAVLALSAIGPLMHVTRMKQTYTDAVKAKVMPWRWLEWSVITLLVTNLVALLAGYQDLATLKLFGIVVLVIGLLSWCAERSTNLGDSKAARVSHLAALVLAAGVVVLIGASLVTTYIYGQVRAPWYVYAAFAVLVVSLALNSFNQYKQVRAKNAWKNYQVVERNYLVINLLSKVALAAVLIVGFSK